VRVIHALLQATSAGLRALSNTQIHADPWMIRKVAEQNRTEQPNELVSAQQGRSFTNPRTPDSAQAFVARNATASHRQVR
jgi:hypothetical protein